MSQQKSTTGMKWTRDKVETWLQACMHITMEYVDFFSCRWVLYKLPSYPSKGRPVNSLYRKHSGHKAVWNWVARSDVYRTVVLGGIMNNKSIQKGTIPSSTVTQQKLRETYRLKSSKTKNYKSHGCIQQSARWMDGKAATSVTRTSNRLL